MSKEIVAVYIDSEAKEKAQVKAANELKIFKFSQLIDKLVKEYAGVGVVTEVCQKEETQ